ncbi:MAG: AAA family ATPase, partial [Erysipelotrichia bacterium]|nr:AAA family ATPase [Erysipelotrichia bacterium]
MKENHIEPVKGLLLFGAPGTGKTMFAKAIAKESNMNIISVAGAQFTSKWVGESDRNLRNIFEQAANKKPCIIFFDELGIPKPDYNLGVGSGSHGKQTARMLEGIEEIILKEKSDGILVYGDTNSTLAGALAAGKLHIPVYHVEAGLRSYNKLMPEEQNRILTDRISDMLLCPTQTAVDNLKKEGITTGVSNTGDIMYDTVLRNIGIANEKYSNGLWFDEIVRENGEISKISEKGYYLATIH